MRRSGGRHGAGRRRRAAAARSKRRSRRALHIRTRRNCAAVPQAPAPVLPLRQLPPVTTCAQWMASSRLWSIDRHRSLRWYRRSVTCSGRLVAGTMAIARLGRLTWTRGWGPSGQSGSEGSAALTSGATRAWWALPSACTSCPSHMLATTLTQSWSTALSSPSPGRGEGGCGWRMQCA